jgi:EAL domain-containing protein (putative c-di-GMP-specific phosphodiesterase class I)
VKKSLLAVRSSSNLDGRAAGLARLPTFGANRHVQVGVSASHRSEELASAPVALPSKETSRGSLLPQVLLVDDEPALLEVTRRLLVAANIDVIACSDGQAALRALESRDFDAVISDVSMPRVSGMDLLRAVRQRDLHLPVIIVTGLPTVETAIQAIEHGAFKYLLKPFHSSSLIDATRRAIQLRRLAKAKEEALALLGTGSGIATDAIGLQTAFQSALVTLWPAFQPIASVQGQCVFGYEALLRSDEPSLPHPGAVLDAAERLQALPHLFRRMCERSCEAFGKAGKPWQLFLNLHPADLTHPMLLEPGSPALAHAKNIVLEVTERATLDQVGDVRERVRVLRDAGYRIAIDDLGAGYAGLSSFASLEPEFVKLDMALIQNVHKSELKQRLVRLMTTLCHDMGMQVVAEGIETREERDAVIELGCDLLQGYYVGRPARTFEDVRW